jgi:hypothetical protein
VNRKEREKKQRQRATTTKRETYALKKPEDEVLQKEVHREDKSEKPKRAGGEM